MTDRPQNLHAINRLGGQADHARFKLAPFEAPSWMASWPPQGFAEGLASRAPEVWPLFGSAPQCARRRDRG